MYVNVNGVQGVIIPFLYKQNNRLFVLLLLKLEACCSECCLLLMLVFWTSVRFKLKMCVLTFHFQKIPWKWPRTAGQPLSDQPPAQPGPRAVRRVGTSMH